jgi:carbamoyl-phosphate synthase large subunit
MSGAKAAAEAVSSRRRDPIRVWSLQELHNRPEPSALSNQLTTAT